MKMFKSLTLFAMAALLFVGCGEKKKEAEEVAGEAMEEVKEAVEPIMETPNIVEVAAGNENFTTLVAAVKAADLVGTLSSEGPFTVFAPTNEAFAKLPAGTVDNLLKPESKSTLTGILTYHVVSGAFNAAAVIDAITANNGTFTVTTVQGETIELSLVDGNVMLKDTKGGTSKVVMADVMASNGIIHAIDTVVMP